VSPQVWCFCVRNQQDARWKSDQWICLTRAHALAAVRLPSELRVDVAGLLKRTRAPDEMYFGTVLALLGELPTDDRALDFEATVGAAYTPSGEPLSALAPRVFGRRLTYADWSGFSAKSPADLAWSAEVVEAARREGCLFARKFAKDVAYEQFVLMVLPGAAASDNDGDADVDSDDEFDADYRDDCRSDGSRGGGGGGSFCGATSGVRSDLRLEQPPDASRAASRAESPVTSPNSRRRSRSRSRDRWHRRDYADDRHGFREERSRAGLDHAGRGGIDRGSNSWRGDDRSFYDSRRDNRRLEGRFKRHGYSADRGR